MHFCVQGQIGKIDFSIQLSKQNWKMSSLNEFLKDSLFDKNNLFQKENYLKNAYKLSAQLNYQFLLWIILFFHLFLIK
jgi:hypothetical protein